MASRTSRPAPGPSRRRSGNDRHDARPTACRIWVCSACAASSARYSLTNPSPTDATRITAMITASVRSPDEERQRRRDHQQQQQGAAQLAPQHLPGSDPAHRDHVGAEDRPPTDHLVGRETVGRGTQPLEDRGRRQRRRFREGACGVPVFGDGRGAHARPERPSRSGHAGWAGSRPVERAMCPVTLPTAPEQSRGGRLPDGCPEQLGAAGLCQPGLVRPRRPARVARRAASRHRDG